MRRSPASARALSGLLVPISALALVLLPSALPSNSAGPLSPTAAEAATPAEITYAAEVLRLTNIQRARHGKPALKLNLCARNRAERQAAAMRASTRLYHQSMSAIITQCRASAAAENVAYGNLTPQGMVNVWMNSPGHRANILSSNHTHMGVGAATTATGRVWAAQVFVRNPRAA